MLVRNYLAIGLSETEAIHDGIGKALHATVFSRDDFRTGISFLNHTILAAGSTIGLHTHGDDEEIYMVLEGNGVMTVNGETRVVTSGDIIVNPPFGSHGLENGSGGEMRLLVWEVRK
jgi:mannose-6-phosphate isomerase-like protein (cupin superfamily)